MGGSRAELVVAACLLAAAWPGPDTSSASCPQPGLLPVREGQPLRVSCTGEGGPLTGAVPLLFGRGLDPGVADAAALEHLPGIGAVRGAALVSARADHPLCRPSDLIRVHGIGPRTVERLRPYLRFGADSRCTGESEPGDAAPGGAGR
jgi:hypothetical protein